MKGLFLTIFTLFSAHFLYSQIQSSQIIELEQPATELQILESSYDNLRLKKQIGQIEAQQIVYEFGSFTELILEGTTQASNIGQAALPVVSRLIEVPHGAEIEITINHYDEEVINLNDLGFDIIMPVQPSWSKSADPSEIVFVKDEEYYSNNSYEDSELVKAEIYGVMRGVRIGRVEIRPYRYNPVENTIIIYNNLDFDISFPGADIAETEAIKSRYYSEQFQGDYHGTLLNYKAPMNKDIFSNYNAPIKYVIVANRAFETTLAPFVEWKTMKGFNVVEGYTDEIGTTNTAIKAWLQNMYDNATPEDPAPLYVLIIGDHSGTYSIPAFNSTATTPSSSHVTDLYFTTFDGASDYFPDMYFGRISATSTAQLQNALDKIIPYEMYTIPSGDFLDRAMLIAGTDNTYASSHGDATIYYAIENYYNTGMGYSDIYAYYYSLANGPYHVMFTQGNSANASASVRSRFPEGVGFANYTAHCNWDGWGDPVVLNSHIPNFNNKDEYPFMIGNCCQSMRFNNTDAFGEILLYTQDAGAVAYIGASNNSYWNEDVYWGIGLTSIGITTANAKNHNYSNTGQGAYDGIWHTHDEPYSMWYYSGAQIKHRGNLEVQASTSTYKKYYWEIYHLSGDPSLIPYNRKPNPLEMTYNPPFIGSTSLEVTTEAYAYIAISQNGVLLDAKWSGANTSVVLEFDVLSNDPVNIVGTKQDRAPAIDTDVMPIAPNPPTAEFVASETDVLEGQTVFFTDLSTNAMEWQWDFGDGGSSTQQNPAYSYNNEGVYTVSLTVYNMLGDDNETKVNYITVSPNTNPPVVDFVADETNVPVGATVNFTDLTQNLINSWEWEFEGGTPSTSTDQHPSVTYNTPGTYDVYLKVTNDFGDDDELKVGYIVVDLPEYCAAWGNLTNQLHLTNFSINTINNNSGEAQYSDFTHITTSLVIGQDYTFNATASAGFNFNELIIWVDWNRDGDFNDLGEEVYKSPIANQSSYSGIISVPEYATQGDVRIRVRQNYNRPGYDSNDTPCGMSGYGEVEDYTLTLIIPEIPPVADFTAENPPACIGTVEFTDMSFIPETWFWEFGDGGTSNEQHPIHNYTAAGTYTVSLTVTNAYGNDTETKTDYIIIDIPEAPITTGDEACGESELTLIASGTGILNWYDAPTYGNLINTGNSLTDNFASTTTYYVESLLESTDTYNVGNTESSTNGNNHTNNTYHLEFTVSTDLTLVSVEVNADGAGNRIIELRDSENNILEHVTRNIPNGVSRVDLGFDIAPGNYQLRCGTAAPNLWRNNAGVSFPYTIPDVISITGSSAGEDWYYYFYDWEIEVTEHCTSSRIPITATIHTQPTVDLGDDIEQCGGNVILDAGAGFVSYIWNGTPGDQTYEPTSTETVNLTVIDNNSCEASDIVNITIHPGISVVVNTTDESTVGANDGTATAVVTGGTIAFAYEWNTGADTESLTNLAAGTYHLTVTDANDCEAYASGVVNEGDVLAPVANFDADITQGCDMLIVQFTDLSSNNPTSWLWDFGDGNNSTDQNPEHVYTFHGQYAVSLTVTNAGGSDDITFADYILVRETPQITMSMTEESEPGAEDGTATVTVTSSYPYTVAWDTGANSETITNLEGGIYCVTVINTEFSCPADDCIEVIIGVAPDGPIADFEADLTNGCDVLTVQFTDLSENEPETWLWDFGDGNNSVLQNPIYTYNSPGTYSVSLTVTNSQGSDVKNMEDYILIGQIPLFTVNTTHASGEHIADGTAGVHITGGIPPHTVLWSNDETGEYIEGLLPGMYSVMVSDAYLCSSTQGFTIDWYTLAQSEYLTYGIYPNPTTSNLIIEFDKDISIEITLIDITGKELKKILSESRITELDLSDIASGVYYLVIKQESENIIIEKIIKN